MIGMPQALMLLLCFVEVVTNARNHGKPKADRSYNLWFTLVVVAIHLGILYWGGFF